MRTILLKDDSSPGGGIAHTSETLGEFLEIIGKDAPSKITEDWVDEINTDLTNNGIQPFTKSRIDEISMLIEPSMLFNLVYTAHYKNITPTLEVILTDGSVSTIIALSWEARGSTLVLTNIFSNDLPVWDIRQFGKLNIGPVSLGIASIRNVTMLYKKALISYLPEVVKTIQLQRYTYGLSVFNKKKLTHTNQYTQVSDMEKDIPLNGYTVEKYYDPDNQAFNIKQNDMSAIITVKEG